MENFVQNELIKKNIFGKSKTDIFWNKKTMTGSVYVIMINGES